jgi:hypothetical protein
MQPSYYLHANLASMPSISEVQLTDSCSAEQCPGVSAPRRTSHLSYSSVVARPGGLGVFVAAIAAWLVLMAGMLGATAQVAAQNPAPLITVAVLAMLPVVAGPMFAGIPVHTAIGADGIATRWFGLSRFVAFRDVTAIRVVACSCPVTLNTATVSLR